MRTSVPSFPLNQALHSYAADVRKWVANTMTGYAVAFGLILIGAISIVLTIGIGVAAAFHFIEVQYGVYVAYGVIGGASLLLGGAALLAGRMLLKRPPAPVPRPRRQTDMLNDRLLHRLRLV